MTTSRRIAPLPLLLIGLPALSVTWPPPVAGDRAQPYGGQSRKAGGSRLETRSAYRSSAGLHSFSCANDIPQSTTARSHRVDSR